MFVSRTRPSLLSGDDIPAGKKRGIKAPVIAFAVAAAVVAGGLSFLASSDPDGLEWSIEKVSGSAELPDSPAPLASGSRAVQSATSIMPDYENTFSGIVGATMVLILVWSVSSVLTGKRRTAALRVPKRDKP